MTSADRPLLTFDLFNVNRHSVALVGDRVRRLFGVENYREFQIALKTGQEISAEDRLNVDKRVYSTVSDWFGIEEHRVPGLWKRAMELADSSVNYARDILFPDEKRATLTTGLVWDDRRPSSALEVLSTPSRLISPAFKYEAGRRLGLSAPCLEVILDHDSCGLSVLRGLNKYLESNLFVGGRRAETEDYHTYSYHAPGTNELVEMGDKKDPPGKGLWVKSVFYPVRRLRIPGTEEQNIEALAFYDPREKKLESRVIKACERSWINSSPEDNTIETIPYRVDDYAFMLVVIGRRAMRDIVTEHLKNLTRHYDGVTSIVDKQRVNAEHGDPDRVQQRRMMISMHGVDKTIEGVIRTHGDDIALTYTVGKYNPQLGMHDGIAHDLYKLRMVANIAHLWWPAKIFRIDVDEAKKAASFEYAERLYRRRRVIPPGYTS